MPLIDMALRFCIAYPTMDALIRVTNARNPPSSSTEEEEEKEASRMLLLPETEIK